VTDEKKKAHQAGTDAIHSAFKAHVASNRIQQLAHRMHEDEGGVASGESWIGIQAQPMGLVDELLISDEYLKQRMEEGKDVVLLKPHERVLTPIEKLTQRYQPSTLFQHISPRRWTETLAPRSPDICRAELRRGCGRYPRRWGMLGVLLRWMGSRVEGTLESVDGALGGVLGLGSRLADRALEADGASSYRVEHTQSPHQFKA
jgi:ClpP class serine protease